jgi:hypothetical protein
MKKKELKRRLRLAEELIEHKDIKIEALAAIARKDTAHKKEVVDEN